MSAKDILFKMAMTSIRLLELCTMGQTKKRYPKKTTIKSKAWFRRSGSSRGNFHETW